MDKHNTVDIDKLDNGIVEVIRQIILVGTGPVEKQVLLDNGFVLDGKDKRLAMKQMFRYSICYKQVKSQEYFYFMSLYRPERRI